MTAQGTQPPQGERIVWAPSPVQRVALACPAFELLYGGAAGGGKTDVLIAGALEDAHLKGYKAVIFRRSYPELDEVEQRCRALIPDVFPGATENVSKHEWRFPSGARLLLRHLEDEKAAHAHRSAEYQYLAFDELTSFTESQYSYLLTRARSSKGLRVRVRAATNPGGPGHAWVMRRWGPWLDPDCPKKAEDADVLWYIPGPDGGSVWVPEGTPRALSRCFVPARLKDNKILTEGDPLYQTRLEAQDPLTRAQLLDGNWLAAPAPKMFFNRDWMHAVPRRPQGARRVRYWDRAATEERPGTDPDWTAGVLLAYDEVRDLFIVEDVVRGRWAPGMVRQVIRATAERDGLGVEIGLSQDPGSAGVFEVDEYLRELTGWPVAAHRETGSKVDRAKAASAAAAPSPGGTKGRMGYLDGGPWVREFLAEVEAFPTKGVHDDQVDALSGAFRVLALGGGATDGAGGAAYEALQRRRGGSEWHDRPPQGGTKGRGYRWR